MFFGTCNSRRTGWNSPLTVVHSQTTKPLSGFVFFIGLTIEVHLFGVSAMSGDAVYITKEKLHELQAELHELKSSGRRDIAQKIAEARSHGDLSENADYDAAKHAQELLEIRIARIQTMLGKAQVIDAKDFPDDKVYILSRVKLMNRKTNKEIDYLLVSAEEADFEHNKLSVTSPLGKALLGRVVGDVVETKVPAGVIQYEVLAIGK